MEKKLENIIFIRNGDCKDNGHGIFELTAKGESQMAHIANKIKRIYKGSRISVIAPPESHFFKCGTIVSNKLDISCEISRYLSLEYFKSEEVRELLDKALNTTEILILICPLEVIKIIVKTFYIHIFGKGRLPWYIQEGQAIIANQQKLEAAYLY